MTSAPARATRATAARWFHLGTFAVGLAGLAVQTAIILTQTDPALTRGMSLPIRLWNLVSYFTIWSNILVTVIAFLLARDPHRRDPVFAVFRLASLTMITVTGVIYALVLAPIWDPTGWSRVADETLHYAVPVLAVFGYVLFGPRPRFDQATLWRAALVPLAWGVYTFVRSPFITFDEGGRTRHWYPYHFIDVDRIGYPQAIVNVLGVTILLVLVGQIYVFLDRRLRPAPR
jgi:hypothetical protein